MLCYSESDKLELCSSIQLLAMLEVLEERKQCICTKRRNGGKDSFFFFFLKCMALNRRYKFLFTFVNLRSHL